MPIRKPLPTTEGAGQLRFPGHDGPVQYCITGDPGRLRPGHHLVLRASLTVTPEIAEQAFRAGQGTLTTAEGVQYRLVMLAHTDGGADVFVELRI